jgi:hypothetical protein
MQTRGYSGLNLSGLLLSKLTAKLAAKPRGKRLTQQCQTKTADGRNHQQLTRFDTCDRPLTAANWILIGRGAGEVLLHQRTASRL